jgi:hypothetical protein
MCSSLRYQCYLPVHLHHQHRSPANVSHLISVPPGLSFIQSYNFFPHPHINHLFFLYLAQGSKPREQSKISVPSEPAATVPIFTNMQTIRCLGAAAGLVSKTKQS